MNTQGLIHRDVMFSFKNSPYIERNLFIQKYDIDPLVYFANIFEILRKYELVTTVGSKILLTAKGRLCVEKICSLFRDPEIKEKETKSLSSSERRKIDKHNYYPNYPGLK